jgi:hypothetical protein
LLLSPAGVHSDLAITITTQRPAASGASKQLVSSYKKKGSIRISKGQETGCLLMTV